LAGVLEEQLLDEPERLHFALFAAPDIQTGDWAHAWVAVCDRAWLQTGLQALETAGYRASRIVAEATPSAPGTALALLSNAMEPAQLVLCTPQGVSLLPLLPATVGLALTQPVLEVVAEPAVMELAQAHFGNQVRLQSPAERALEAALSPWNLAQLELSASPGGRLLKRVEAGWKQFLQAPAWRPARWGLVALLLVQVLALNALAWQQRRLLEAQRAAIDDVLLQTFPDQRLVIDAPLQMQRAVDDLARAHGVAPDVGLARVFSIIGPQVPDSLRFSTIALTDGQLLLTATGLDTADTAPLLAALDAHKLRAKVQGGQITITAITAMTPEDAR
jgi:general secretion pathway protein L